MSLTVLEPGLLTLPVDGGRSGFRHLGLPLSGAADRAAWMLGNALLRNAPDAVALEITLAGPVLRAEHPTACVVFGAPFDLSVSGRGAITPGYTFMLESGETLTIRGTSTGVRGYLCVGGGIEMPERLGSRSAFTPIQAGDLLRCSPSHTAGRALPFVTFPEQPTEVGILRVIEGLQRDWFPNEDFFQHGYRVSPTSNRMGLRLLGYPLDRRVGELVSEPVATGAVQITNDGLPVILGVDGQTIGGYPKIAHVIRADLDRLAQLRVGQEIRFVRVSLAEAMAIDKERNNRLREWRIRLAI
ncbi:MAG: biotin-dependent carboxyltransferase family protein [Bacteroidales bacterium]|nr:biotin-dependent carboxyltransferase family protein [Bacteroidales bacterium]